MSPKNLFPMFIKLKGRKTLVVGGGEVGTRKAAALIESGADVTVVSPEVTDRLKRLIDEGKVKYVKGRFKEELLDDVFICVSAVGDDETDSEIERQCRGRGVLVNVVDVPERCDFYFPSVVSRGDLTIAISSGGVSPAMTKKIRQDMEVIYGPEYEGVIQLMGSIREYLRGAGLFGKRLSEVMGKVARLPLARIISEGKTKELNAVIDSLLNGDGKLKDVDLDIELDPVSRWGEEGVKIFVVGMSHKSAPVDVREKMGLSKDSIEKFLEGLKEFNEITECVFLSTCNRVEILGCAVDVDRAVESSISYLGRFHGRVPEEMRSYFYIKEGREAVEHVFSVASSLDSMVVGEPQILGQVKDSYRAATSADATGIILNRLMHRAFFAAKRVKNETDIASRPVSIGSAAVWLAEEALGGVSGKTVFMIGAGEMGEETLRNLIGSSVGSILLANRTHETALSLAERFCARAMPWDEIHKGLEAADIVICSTGSKEPIIMKSMVEGAFSGRGERPITIIDIAVPRDVEDSVADIDNVSLYNIDDLDSVIRRNLKEREGSAEDCRRIIAEESEKFTRWLESLDVVPTIVSLREKLEKIGEEETEKLISSWRGINDKEREAVRRLTNSIINKILHDPTVYLKKEAWLAGDMTIDLVKGILGLSENRHEEDQDRDEG
ncbi:MAG: glutamyl-tRNA reductase [Deltaproteobacteria bacterium]|uniref:Glutamyl-tRNA reductase n=1 Tax=Candidatus Zymogenus saltonus TaxID=2844893 RepID=A0A9D8KEA3_9DELT|nr:glutamyl-tRNA reductase [Candidatus Zymogenus saltonus]